MEAHRQVRLAKLGAGILLIIALQAALYLVGDIGLGDYRRLVVFVVLWGCACALYVAAAVLVAREKSSRGTLALVLGGAALFRIIPLACPPLLSTDVFRYVWDGRVADAGENPYCCIPSAPELERLQDGAIYPFINRSDYAPTIYPPVAQMVFAVVARVSQTVFAMKCAMVLAEVVAIAAMIALLARAGLPLTRVLVYAWNPIAVWEFSGNGHVDALAIAGIGLALLAASSGRQAFSGVALAAATLTKFIPVVIGPALWRGGSTGGWKPWLALPAAFLATVIACYACYATAGLHVFGFLGGYSREEGLTSGGGIYVLQLLSNFVVVPAWGATAWLALGALALAALSLRMLMRERNANAIGSDALLLAMVFTVAISPHYAWYFCWLAYLACLAPWPSAIWLTIACAACYLDVVHTNTGWTSLIYGPFALLAARDVFARDPGNIAMTRKT